MRTEDNRRSVLVTCDTDSEALTLEELRRVASAHLPGTWIDTGDAVQGSILLLETGADFATFSEQVDNARSVFIRHIAPVDYELDLKGEEADMATIAELVPEFAARLEPGRSFSVQSRVLGNGKLPFRKVVLNETISQSLETKYGATMDCRTPEQVISILCSPSKAYVGLSPTSSNRSAWPGGKHRFKREDEQVSRAEFKLLEAMSVFDFEFPSQGKGLDIGASPGGWSRVLAEAGLKVDAVDPGDLDPRLRRNRSITHIRRRIQEYQSATKEFDAIVNDMKMDARDSIEIMLNFATRLAQSGVAVITLKMPKAGASPGAARKSLDMLRADLDRLASGFTVVGARQLYHNRSEVTVVLRSRAAGR